MNIQEVREKFPQYKDLSDEKLAEALHKKFYPDMSYADFAKRIGLTKEEPKKTTVKGVASEVVKGALRGVGGVGEMAARAATGVMGPVGGLVRRGAEALAAPSQEMVTATPETEAERFAGTAAEITGAGLAGGGAGSLRAAVGSGLAGVGGAAGEQIGGVPGRIIGTLLPGGISTAARLAKNTVAKGSKEVIDAFRASGAEPSAGQATGNMFLLGLENLATKFPGGAAAMKKFIEAQQKGLGSRTRTGVAADTAGRAIERGVSGFVERTRSTWNRLDDALTAKVGPANTFVPGNTISALDDLTRAAPGAERTTAGLVSQKVAEISKNFKADLQANAGVMPFNALRALRSRVGMMLDDALVSGVPQGELKRLYAAVTRDLESAAKQAGAGKEFARQNAYYRARMDRIEGVLDKVIGKGKQPEDIFLSVLPQNADKVNKFRAVMRSLPPEERNTVTRAVINRLGRAKPGHQSDIGDVFSSETFLTNWSNMSEGVRAQLLPNHAMRQQMSRIAKAAQNVREGRGVYANPSGTAGSFAAYTLYTAPFTAAGFFLGGAPGAAAAYAATAGIKMGAARVSAKMLTNPKVVDWLAKPVNPMKAGEAAAHLARLGTIYNQIDDEELRRDLAEFVTSSSNTQSR